SACSEDSETRDDERGGERVVHLRESGGIRETRVFSGGAAVHLDLETGEAVAPGEGDLSFSKWDIGVAEGVTTVVLDGATFDDVEDAPAEGYAADAEAFNGEDAWYSYDPVTHELTPKPRVYVLRTAEGNHFKIAMLSYVDDEGAAHF